MSDASSLIEEVAETLDVYPDFPEPGILFRDITPLFEDPHLLRRIVGWLTEQALGAGAEKIVGIESRGFLLGVPVALEAGLPFVLARKAGKLPGETTMIDYALEYGSAQVEMQSRGVGEGEQVFVIDDLLATGGTARATAGLIEKLGGTVCGMSFLIELAGLAGGQMLEAYNYNTLLILASSV
jgi:adenine phosphoribosyltransferase